MGRLIAGLEGKIDGMAIHVPVAVCSIVDFVAVLEKDISIDQVNKAFGTADRDQLEGILSYSREKLVISDFVGSTASAIFDAPSTMVMDSNMVKALARYENEWGYSCRLADMARYISDNGF